MTSQPAPFPDLATLTTRLNQLPGEDGFVPRPVTVLSRKENLYASTFPSEVVTCRLADGQERRLLCKYAAGRNHDAHGHRGGVRYEAKVYRRVLRALGASVPRCYEASEGAFAEDAWLILDYLDQGVRLSDIGEKDALLCAARWCGHFHAAAATWLAERPRPGLTVYGAAYYRKWAQRALQAADSGRDRPWLQSLCARWEEASGPLLAAATFIHGEFYPHNILVHGEDVYPVDWESAAIAAGEIDLAAVTEGWPEKYVAECMREYRRVRWPEEAPADFERALLAAQLYLMFRWLGGEQEIAPQDTEWCLERARTRGERLGLI
jgi:hypothetical protein